MPSGGPQFSLSGNHVGVNLAFTKFLFILPRRDDDAAGTRLRAAGAIIVRGFFNDFDADFECEDDHVETFDRICHNLRDVTQNPEWRYVMEGPLWRGRRVLKW